MVNKNSVLALVDYYLPGYKGGGPIRSIANMVSQLSDHLSFRVLTRDRDLGEVDRYGSVTPGKWHQVDGASVYYCSGAASSFRLIAKILSSTDYDVLYLNSFFSPVFTIWPLLLRRAGLIPAKPIVLAPRGEFSSGAIRLKGAKKRAFVQFARLFGIYNDVLWQASSAYEEADIRQWFGNNCRVCIAPDLPASPKMPLDEPREPKSSGQLNIVFLSRISRKKNLAGALAMLDGLRGRVTLDIYGPKEDPIYWAECREAIDALPTNISVRYMGTVPHDQVAQVFSRHHLFLFPTYGENYGHVIVEAFASGCPVLVSDQTPWRGLEMLGVGWDITLSRPDVFGRVIQNLIDMSDDDYRSISERARAYGLESIHDSYAVQQNYGLFREALPERCE